MGYHIVLVYNGVGIREMCTLKLSVILASVLI